ncbi:DUF3450 domain-containing protein [bacterium]|nr:DUF3450 domain-containing protein [bacterium]
MTTHKMFAGLATAFLVFAAWSTLPAQESRDSSRSRQVRVGPSTLAQPAGIDPSGRPIFHRRAESKSPTLQQQADQVVKELKQAHAAATDEEKKAAGKTFETAEQRLSTVIGEQFDELMVSREAEVKQLQDRIKRLEQEIAKSRNAKDDIVALRVKTLMNEASGLGFPSNSRSRSRIEYVPRWSGSSDSVLQSLPVAIPARPVAPTTPRTAR